MELERTHSRPARSSRSGTSTSFEMKLVNPANKRKYNVIVVGTGLAGGVGRGDARASSATTSSASASRTRRAARTSIAAQGGINAAKNYQNDGDSDLPPVLRHDQGRRLPRARGERLPARADQRQHHRPVRRAGRAVRARVRRPAREPLVRRRAGLAHVLRARPDRPAAAARRVPGARAADRDAAACKMYPRTEMLDLVVVDGQRARHRHARPASPARSSRTPPTRSCSRPAATATSSTCRRTRRAATPPRSGARYKRGAAFANPCFTQIHPTCIPVSGDYQSKLTLMRESLRNDGRVWVPKTKGDKRAAERDPRGRARLLPRAEVSELRQPRAARHRVARREGGVRRRARRRPERARRLSRLRRRDQAPRRGRRSRERYGNLFEMYERITGENPYEVPMRIYPAVHYTMGGLWVDYNLMSTIPGLLRARRGELLRSRREPPRRERADAGARRRLLHHPVHDRRLPRVDEARAGDGRRTRGSARPSADVRERDAAAARRSRASARSTRSTASSARSCGTTAAWRATRRACSEALEQIPRAARGVLARTSTCRAAARS